MALWGDRDNFQSVAAGIATVDLSNFTVDIGAAPFTAGVAYSLTQAPRSLDENPAAVSQSAGSISSTRYFGVGSTAMPSSDSVFGPAHSGWVGVQTYTDNHGNFRVKTEVLVAMSGIQTGNETFPNYKA